MSGSFGIGCFLFSTKNITTGEGGMITTNKKILRIDAIIADVHGITKSTYQREKLDKPRENCSYSWSQF